MKIKVSEATPRQIDWLVAVAAGVDFFFDGITWGFTLYGQSQVLESGWDPSMRFVPSSDWAQGGPIIEREGITIRKEEGGWSAYFRERLFEEDGDTPLVAAMRCFVASRLGDEVDVPKELA